MATTSKSNSYLINLNSITKPMLLQKYPYYVFLALVALLLVVLPQINITGYVNSTITSKFIFFAFGCMVLLGLLTAIIFLTRPISVQISKLDIILLFLVLYITLNRYVLQPEYGFSIRYMELLGLTLIYLAVRIITARLCVFLLLAIIVSGTIKAVYGNLL